MLLPETPCLSDPRDWYTNQRASGEKGVRKALLDSLVSFVPTLQNPPVAERLEVFRATLASFEPAAKSKDTAAKGVEELLDSTVGLDSVILSELPIANSRAGLYIYLDACVRCRFCP